MEAECSACGFLVRQLNTEASSEASFSLNLCSPHGFVPLPPSPGRTVKGVTVIFAQIYEGMPECFLKALWFDSCPAVESQGATSSSPAPCLAVHP